MSPTRKLASAALAGALALGSPHAAPEQLSSAAAGSTVAKESRRRRRSAVRRQTRRHADRAQPADFEQIDPGLAYYNIDYEVVYATQRPLFSYKPNTFSDPSRIWPPNRLRSFRRQDDHGSHSQRRALSPPATAK